MRCDATTFGLPTTRGGNDEGQRAKLNSAEACSDKKHTPASSTEEGESESERERGRAVEPTI